MAKKESVKLLSSENTIEANELEEHRLIYAEYVGKRYRVQCPWCNRYHYYTMVESFGTANGIHIRCEECKGHIHSKNTD